ncbi:hypothetical protein LXA43DRAFT_1058348 [Ganoderma leucocontextum]|nr:hypothetical protein LXA43DRAFT_1058348 [Ganoderma leucocontextum]
MENRKPYPTSHPNPGALPGWNSSWEPAPVTQSLTTTTTDAVLPHPGTIPGHSQLVCEKCCRKFDLRGDLEKHRDTHRKDQVQYWCIPQCGEGYTRGAELQRHQAYCQEIIAVQYFDPTFTPAPISATGAPNHLTSTSIQPGGGAPSTSAAQGQGVPPQPAKGAAAKGHPMMCHFPVCYRCPRDFKSRPMLEKHLAEHDRGTLIFCTTPECGMGYTTLHQMTAHQTTSGCGGRLPKGSADVWRDMDPPELHHRNSGASRSNGAYHADAGADPSTGNPAADVNVVKALYEHEETRSLDESHLRELERSYRKSAYPTEEEVQRLKRELRLRTAAVVRRCSSSMDLHFQNR